MILLNRNKRKLWYGVRKSESVDIYETDDDGNIIFMEMSDGEKVPMIIETKVQEYTEIVEFKGNISSNGNGTTDVADFGIDTSLYSAVLTVAKGLLPIDETSLVWLSEPSRNEFGDVPPNSADYKVVAVNKLRLGYDSYALKSVV